MGNKSLDELAKDYAAGYEVASENVLFYCAKFHETGDNECIDQCENCKEIAPPLIAPSANNQIEGEKVLRWVNQRIAYLIEVERDSLNNIDAVPVGSPERRTSWDFIKELGYRKNELRDLKRHIEGADVPAIQPAEIPKLPVNQVWDLSGITDDQKHAFVDGMVKITAENFLKVFVMLALKDGIESGVVNEATGDQFILIFKKLKYPSAQAEEEPQMEDAFDVLCPFCNRPIDIDKSDSCVCGAKIEEKEAPTGTLSLPVEEVPKMSDELAAMADVAAIEYGDTNGQSVCREEIDYDNSADLTDAFLAGQNWMYREMQKEISSLRTQLSEAQKDRDEYKKTLDFLSTKMGISIPTLMSAAGKEVRP